MFKKSKKFDIFISYRRNGGFDTAKIIYNTLRIDGLLILNLGIRS